MHWAAVSSIVLLPLDQLASFVTFYIMTAWLRAFSDMYIVFETFPLHRRREDVSPTASVESRFFFPNGHWHKAVIDSPLCDNITTQTKSTRGIGPIRPNPHFALRTRAKPKALIKQQQ